MNILLLNSIGRNKWGGGEKWMILAAEGLMARGHRVVIGCRKDSVLERKANQVGIPVAHVSICSDFSVSGGCDLLRLAKRERFNVIVGCQNRDVRIAGFISRWIGRPLILGRQGVQLIHRSFKYKWSFQKFCDGIITNTQTIKDEYDSYGWWDNDYVKVIHNGVEEPQQDVAPIDLSKWIPKDVANPRIVLSAGRLSNQKGYDYLIDAAVHVCSKYDDVYFFIAGKGKEERRLTQLVISKGLEKRVFLIGFHNDLTPLFRQSALFVLSSLYEGMPNVVMEAMMNRVPVVSTRVNGVEELIGSDNCGVIVPPADSAALASEISRVLEMKDCNEMIDKARQRVDQLFSVNAMITHLEHHFSSLIAKKRTPQKILIIQTAFIGDVILATPVIEKLHHFFSASEIDFLLRKGNEGLLDGHPYVNEVIVFDKKGGKYRNLIKLIRAIRSKRYDDVVNIQRYSTTGLITVLSGAKQTVGFEKNSLSRFFTFRIPHHMESDGHSEHEVVRNLRLIEHLTDNHFQMPKLYPKAIDFASVKQDNPYYCIAPTSVWFTKQFPFSGWVDLIDALPFTHDVFLMGAKSDAVVCENLIMKTHHPKVFNRAGDLSFLQSAALMSGATMNFVNDSAPLHITSAMNAPVRALFCSTVKAFGYTPLSDDSQVLETDHLLSCRPCGLHGKAACPQGHFMCGDIAIEKILGSMSR